MNERIQKLIKEASLDDLDRIKAVFDVEKFAQSLIEDVLTRVKEERAGLERTLQSKYESVDFYDRIQYKIYGLDGVAYAIQTLYAEE